MRRVLACMAAVTYMSQARAVPEPGAGSALFDPPQATKRIEGETLDAAHSFECTWYADDMLRETDTDSPGFGPSYLVARPPGAPPPPCAASPAPHDIKLPTSEQAFIGRKGPFLFYEATDPNGPVPFAILHAPDGRAIYSDAWTPSDGLKALSLVAGVLHLTYLRAFYAPCSILQDGAACWAKTIKAAHFVHAIATRPPPIQACAAPYRAAKAPATDPSMITYAVEMTLTAEGRSTILSRGTLGCEPGP